jgi:hypothetical protein
LAGRRVGSTGFRQIRKEAGKKVLS